MFLTKSPMAIRKLHAYIVGLRMYLENLEQQNIAIGVVIGLTWMNGLIGLY